MKEKKPYSPIVVYSAIMFLGMFIAMPPLFRVLFPEEETVKKPSVVMTRMSCEAVSIKESMKVSFSVNYENGKAVNGAVIYSEHAPTDDDATKYSKFTPKKAFADEISVFKTLKDVELEEIEDKTLVFITKENLANNVDVLELQEYMMDQDAAYSTYTGAGYSCVKTDL